MIEGIYQVLAAVGFTHPLHPAITHIPMGMVIGGCLFRIASFKKNELARVAYYCYVLALLFVLPTVLFGVTDWIKFYHGDFSGPIIAKFILAGILVVLLTVAIRLEFVEQVNQKAVLAVYLLAMLTAIGLGFAGGQIIYG